MHLQGSMLSRRGAALDSDSCMSDGELVICAGPISQELTAPNQPTMPLVVPQPDTANTPTIPTTSTSPTPNRPPAPTEPSIPNDNSPSPDTGEALTLSASPEGNSPIIRTIKDDGGGGGFTFTILDATIGGLGDPSGVLANSGNSHSVATTGASTGSIPTANFACHNPPPILSGILAGMALITLLRSVY